jgi:hypothetical protein
MPSIRLAYQTPASNTFLLEQISTSQPPMEEGLGGDGWGYYGSWRGLGRGGRCVATS